MSNIIQFTIEPDISDQQVMEALRQAIQHSKTHKCKSAFIMLLPEDELAGDKTFIRIATRANIKEKCVLLNYLNTTLMLFNDYIAGLFNR